MILKFLRNKKGGGVGSVNYLLNKERVKNGTAKILQGSEKHTRGIIESLTKKQKVTFGVLSFEERDITEQQKQELMHEFEKTFFAGLEKEQYNILWVQHTDKDRLELNFIIPKIELSTGRSFNPYFNGTDFHLAELFQKTANLKYGFSDPKDPKKYQTLQGEYKKTGVMKDYEELDKLLHNLVADNVLESKEDIVKFLEENGVQITRNGKGYIGVKLDSQHKQKRLKGGIYEDKFTSIEELATISREQETRERKFNERDTRTEFKASRERLDKAVSKRAAYNREFYAKPKRRNTKATKENNKIRNELDRQASGNVRRSDKQPSNKDKGLLDEFGRYAQRRAGERKTLLSSIRESTTRPRTSIYEQFKEDRERLYSKAQRVMPEWGRARANRKRDIKAVKYITAQTQKLRRAVEAVAGERHGERHGELGNTIERIRNDLEREVSRTYDTFEQSIRTTEQKIEQVIEDREEPSQGWGMSM